MPQQLATDEAGHVWDVSDPSRPMLVQAAGNSQSGQIMSLPQTPQQQAQEAASRASVDRTRQEMAVTGATLPYAGTKAAADAAKAQADAQAARIGAEKAAREAAIERPAVSPQAARMQADLSQNELLNAIADARRTITDNPNTAAGFLGNALGKVGGTASSDLEGSLTTIGSRNVLDNLARMKAQSQTGASGMGALSEREGAYLRDSIASLKQSQSPQKLLDSLAQTERHYRNMYAMANGEDPRDPKIAEKYGIAAMPGTQDGPTGLARGQNREEPDPALKGVNDRIRSMIANGRSANEIVGFMNAVQPGLGDNRAQDVAAAAKFRSQNPNVPINQYPISVENRSVPMSGARQIVNNAAQTPGGAFVMAGADALTAGNLARMTGNQALGQAGIDAVSRANPISGVLGTAAGGAATSAALEGALPFRAAGALGQALRQPVADALYGGIYGASQDGSPAKGALEGVAGGMLGRGVTRALGGVLRGVQNADAQALRGLGVRMSPGQALANEGRFGRWMKGREDRLAGYSGIGEKIKGQQRNSLIDMNRAAFNEAVPPTAQSAIGNYAEQGVEDLQGAVRGAYGHALDGRRFDLTEPQLQQDVTGAVQRGLQIPRTGQEFGYAVRQRIDPVMTNKAATGPQMQDVLQGLRDADFGTDAMGNAASDAAGNVRTAFTDMIGRQAPDVMPRLTEADAGYRRLNILADAVGRAKNTEGIFTPAQLGQSAFNNAKRFNGPIAAATTERPFYDLQRAAQNVLPSKVPDSGTAGRLDAGKGVFGALRSAGRNALNAPLYSDTLQPLLNAAILDRPQAAIDLGERISRRSRLGGLFGAPLLADYGP